MVIYMSNTATTTAPEMIHECNKALADHKPVTKQVCLGRRTLLGWAREEERGEEMEGGGERGRKGVMRKRRMKSMMMVVQLHLLSSSFCSLAAPRQLFVRAPSKFPVGLQSHPPCFQMAAGVLTLKEQLICTAV